MQNFRFLPHSHGSEEVLVVDWLGPELGTYGWCLRGTQCRWFEATNEDMSFDQKNFWYSHHTLNKNNLIWQSCIVGESWFFTPMLHKPKKRPPYI